jgi:hypothetical protein
VLTLRFFEIMVGLFEAVTATLLGYMVDSINARITDALLALLGLGGEE